MGAFDVITDQEIKNDILEVVICTWSGSGSRHFFSSNFECYVGDTRGNFPICDRQHGYNGA